MTANRVGPRHLAVLMVQLQVARVRQEIADHIRYRGADDLFNSEIRVYLERVAELLQEAAQRIAADVDPDDAG
jgi:hypothetical protein